jgi:hypothetical protein
MEMVSPQAEKGKPEAFAGMSACFIWLGCQAIKGEKQPWNAKRAGTVQDRRLARKAANKKIGKQQVRRKGAGYK